MDMGCAEGWLYTVSVNKALRGTGVKTVVVSTFWPSATLTPAKAVVIAALFAFNANCVFA